MLPAYIDLFAARIADAIDHEIESWAAAGWPLSPAAVETLQADLSDAQTHGDLERLKELWRGLPGLAQELVTFDQNRGSQRR
jgi:hypothetical protein